MNKSFKIKPVAWFLAGWFVVFVTLFPQSVVICVGESGHAELYISAGTCCNGDPDGMASAADTSANLPTNACVDCNHIQVPSWYYSLNHPLGKVFGRHINVRNQAVCALASTFESRDERGTYIRPRAVFLIQPLLLEHLSTTILIC